MIKKMAVAAFLSLVLLTGIASAGEALKVEEMVFCTAVESRRAVGVDVRFPDTVGRVYCYTRISGAVDATGIVHVWYFNDEEKFRLSLDVKSTSWRTWSSKKIVSRWTGDWRVDVLSSDGDLLDSKAFTIE